MISCKIFDKGLAHAHGMCWKWKPKHIEWYRGNDYYDKCFFTDTDIPNVEYVDCKEKIAIISEPPDINKGMHGADYFGYLKDNHHKFDYVFENFKKINFFEKNDVVTKINVWLGNKRNVEAVIKESVDFNIPRNKSIDDIKVQTEFQNPLNAPIKKDAKIGVLSVEIKGLKTLKYDLYAKENVDKVGYIRKIKRILEYKIKNLLN